VTKKSSPEVNFQNLDALEPRVFLLGLVLVLFPAFVYFYSIHIYTTNTPFSDDYVSHLQALLPIIKSDTLWDKLALIFTIDYEHRLGFNKIVFYMVYCVLGEIDL